MEVQEIWKRIKGFPDYKISNFGRCLSSRKLGRAPIILKLIKNSHGYFSYQLSNGQKKYKKLKTRFQIKIHRLVALHFIKNHLNKFSVNHKNGDKSDNSFKNLEWVTNSENQKHACLVKICHHKKCESVL